MGKPSRRPLTEGERALATATFGALRAERVRLCEGAGRNPLATLAFQFDGVDAVTLVRTIHFRNRYAADFSAPGADRGLFLHEMTHVWQFQALGPVRFGLRYLRELVRHRFNRNALYHYGPEDDFATATLEAQAQMVQERAANLAGTGLHGFEGGGMAEEVRAIEAGALAGRPLRYFDFVMAAFVAILLLSNVIGAGKIAAFPLPGGGEWAFGAGILFFPISYVIGDVLTEVYGYARARRCIWAGFVGVVFMALMSTVVVALPPASSWHGQEAYLQIFGQVPQIVFASVLAFWAGEFVNSYVLARMKIWSRGRHLWTRTIGSTIAGEGVDSLIFYPVAFFGVMDAHTIVLLGLTQWGLKVAWEVILTPVTYLVVGWLKRKEGIDVYDEGTDFTPFRAKV